MTVHDVDSKLKNTSQNLEYKDKEIDMKRENMIIMEDGGWRTKI